MSDMIDRNAVLALPYRLSPSLNAADGYYVSVDAIRALPAVEVGVTPLSFDQREPSFHAAGCVIGLYYIIESDVMIDPFKLERPGWLSIIGFPTLEAAKAAAQSDYEARIRSALTVTPARKEVMPDDAAEIDGLPQSFDTSPGVTAGAVTPAPDAGKVQALVEALEKINVGEGWAAKIARAALAAMKEG